MPDSSEHIRHLAGLFLSADARQRAGDAAAIADAEEGLRDPAPPSASQRRGPARPLIEFVVVGHLPVRAGLWLTQYADDVARMEGPTGLVRLDADQSVLEVLRGDREVARASKASSLSEALGTVARQVMRWIIRPRVGAEAASIMEAGPQVVTILSGADEIAVVAAYRAIKDVCEAFRRTSADAPRSAAPRLPRIELAILGAGGEQAQRAAEKIRRTAAESLGIEVVLRRTVQAMGPLGSTLHFRFPSDGETSAGELIDVIRACAPACRSLIAGTIAPLRRSNHHGEHGEVTEMGSNDTGSDDHGKGSQADSNHAGQPRLPAGRQAGLHSPPVSSVSSVVNQSAPALHQADESPSSSPPHTSSAIANDEDESEYVMHDVRDHEDGPIDDSQWRSPAEERRAAPAASTPGPLRLATPTARGGQMSQPAHVSDSRGAPMREAASTEPSSGSRHQSSTRLAPKPAVHVEPKRMVPTPKPRATPPARALTTWIKGLALLPVRCPDAPSIEIAADTHGNLHVIGWESDLRQLALTSSWVRKHREILRMACAEHSIRDAADEPTMHVVTSEPAAVSDLHGCAMMLHLVAPVEFEGHAGWFAAPLK